MYSKKDEDQTFEVFCYFSKLIMLNITLYLAKAKYNNINLQYKNIYLLLSLRLFKQSISV